MMKTWMVVTEIFLLGLWVDDWGLGVESAIAQSGRSVHDLQSSKPTPFQTTSTNSSNDLSQLQWYCPAFIRPPPLRE
jgi:hypothetical protein